MASLNTPTISEQSPDFASGPLASVPGPTGNAYEVLDHLKQIVHAWDAGSRQLSIQHHITLPQLLCLRVLIQSGSMMVTQLSQHLSLSSATLIGILDRLEIKGFVQRARTAPDRRKVMVTITPEGRAFADTINQSFYDGVMREIDDMQQERRAALVTEIRRLAEIFTKYASPQ